MFLRKSDYLYMKGRIEKIDELEQKLTVAELSLKETFQRLTREIEHSYDQKLDHKYADLSNKIEKEISKIENGNLSKEVDELRKLVLKKLEEYKSLCDELRDLTVKQKEYINLAAQEAVEKALSGEIRAIVTHQVKKLVSEEGKELLFDESEKSVLGVSSELTKEVIDMLKQRVSDELLTPNPAGDSPASGSTDAGKPEGGAELEKRKKDVLSMARHKEFGKLLGSLSAGLMPMLVGPAGTGKSTAVEQAAYELGFDFYTSNRVQMAHELTGYKDATGNYQPTQFYQAYKNGGVFFLDEVDGSSPEALVTINTAMAQGYMNFPDGKVYMHKDFRLAAAGNTYGTGADAQYVGRNELDAATLDRFVVVRWDYDKKLESQIIKDKEFLEFGWKVRSAVSKLKLPIIISTRGLINVYNLLNVKAFSLDEMLESVLFEGVDAQTLLTINREISVNGKYKNALKNLADRLKNEEKGME